MTLFEQGPAAGGTAQGTIPAERLPEAILRREIDDVLDAVMAEGFEACLLAVGLGESVPLPATVQPKSGVAGALEFLAKVKQGAGTSGTVLVIGGGNTAIDAALSALRSGADEVSIVYRRSFAEMPAAGARRGPWRAPSTCFRPSW